MPRALWKLGGRVTPSNTYFFYQLAFIPGYGLAITDYKYVNIDTFWGNTT